MVGTWLLELYLDQLNRSLLEVKGRPSEQGVNGQANGKAQAANGDVQELPLPDQLTQDLRAFLKRNVKVLDVNVTVSLLAGYGRMEDLMEYATYREVTAAVPSFINKGRSSSSSSSCNTGCMMHLCLSCSWLAICVAWTNSTAFQLTRARPVQRGSPLTQPTHLPTQTSAANQHNTFPHISD